MPTDYEDYDTRTNHVVWIDPDTGDVKTHPAEGLPLLEDTLDGSASDVAENESTGSEWTHTDWGEDQDFFLKRVILILERYGASYKFFQKLYNGVLLWVGVTNVRQYLYRTISSREFTPVYTNVGGSNTQFSVAVTLPLSGKVASSETLTLAFYHTAGATLTRCLWYVGGIPL